MRDLLLDHSVGLLAPAIAAQAEALIQNDPLAASIWAEFQLIDEHLKTDTGKQWLGSTPDSWSSQATQTKPLPAAEIGHAISDTFNRCLETLSAAIADLFTFRATLATASGEEGLEKLIDEKTLVEVKPDSAGRLWLQVTSKDERFRNGVFKFEVEDVPSVLRFAEVKPGVYSAQVCVDPEVAEKLAQGAKPHFIPAESSE
jgi:hypothetical protein